MSKSLQVSNCSSVAEQHAVEYLGLSCMCRSRHGNFGRERIPATIPQRLPTLTRAMFADDYSAFDGGDSFGGGGEGGGVGPAPQLMLAGGLGVGDSDAQAGQPPRSATQSQAQSLFLLPHQHPALNIFALDNHAQPPIMYNPQQFPMGPGQPGAGASYSTGPNGMSGAGGPGAMMQNPAAHMAGPIGQSTLPSLHFLSRIFARRLSYPSGRLDCRVACLRRARRLWSCYTTRGQGTDVTWRHEPRGHVIRAVELRRLSMPKPS